jgi:menaquinone-dependent protoporphyrinogen oxidase
MALIAVNARRRQNAKLAIQEATMKYFIAYATIEGQTKKIAETIAATIEKGGDMVLIMNISDMFEFTLEQPDGVILCAPIHAGHYPSTFADFTHRETDWLNAVPSAFVSVSLSIVSDTEEDRVEARGIADRLVAESGWTPSMIHHAGGALRYIEYDFFKRWMAKRLADSRGAPIDSSRDYEFTDWAALAAFTADFVGLTAKA